MYKAGIITASDQGSRGQRVDESGRIIREMLEKEGYEIVGKLLVEDDKEQIKAAILALCQEEKAALVLTTGGTGFGPRDVTPEATLEVATRLAPGISEAMRGYSMTFTKRAMLSRGVSVLRDDTLIVNLPGSPKAVGESLGFVLPELKHALDILRQNDAECAR